MSDDTVGSFFGGALAQDFFRLVCGFDPIGVGVSRTVYECTLRDDIVLKFETPSQSFQNVLEWEIWGETHAHPAMRRWLAPCLNISPCGTVLVQLRTTAPLKHEYPRSLPRFLEDTKRSNYGMYEGRFVCHDYGLNPLIAITSPLKRRKVDRWL